MAVETQPRTHMPQHTRQHTPTGQKGCLRKREGRRGCSRVSVETVSERASARRGDTSVCPDVTHTLTIFLLLSAMCSSVSISTSLLTEVCSSRSSNNSGSCKRGRGALFILCLHSAPGERDDTGGDREKESRRNDGETTSRRDPSRSGSAFRVKRRPLYSVYFSTFPKEGITQYISLLSIL